VYRIGFVLRSALRWVRLVALQDGDFRMRGRIPIDRRDARETVTLIKVGRLKTAVRKQNDVTIGTVTITKLASDVVASPQKMWARFSKPASTFRTKAGISPKLRRCVRTAIGLGIGGGGCG
jgi:hypothetical protein